MESLQARLCGDKNTTEECFVPREAVRFLWNHGDSLLVQLKITSAALLIIYMAAHGAIQRPHSAAPPRKSKNKKRSGLEEEDDDDSKTHQYAQSLLATDIVAFPVMAGTVLIGLYYLIKWLDDPDLINRIFRWYLGIAGLVSATISYHHALHLLKGFFLPLFWTDLSYRWVYAARPKIHTVYRRSIKGKPSYEKDNPETTWERLPEDTLPAPYSCPDFLSIRKLVTGWSWEVLNAFHDRWTLVINAPGAWPVPARERFTIASLISFAIALSFTVICNLSTYDAVTMQANNISGAAFAYSTTLMISPTSFAIGSSVLLGLCVYDIIMVFYTPFMVTVAKSIDAPIKLQFSSKDGVSMLGLGDIIIPGIFIAMCLRFDLYCHYKKKITYKTVSLTTTNDDETTGEVHEIKKEGRVAVKAKYIDPTGHWGEWFWLGATGRKALGTPVEMAFQKTYFHAAMVGYTLGMAATLVVLTIFQRGQPALLYLVPGVVIATWTMAAIRGELKLLWNYTEDGSLDTEEVVVDVRKKGRENKKEECEKTAEKGENDTTDASDCGLERKEGSPGDEIFGKQLMSFDSFDEEEDDEGTNIQRDVLLMASILLPKRLRRKDCSRVKHSKSLEEEVRKD